LVVVGQIKKSEDSREVNMRSLNVKRLFVMNKQPPSGVPASVDVVLQTESRYGYRLVTVRSTVQVRVLDSLHFNISLGGLLVFFMVRASDLRLNGREFDPRPPHCRSVGTGMGDRLRAGKLPRYVTSHPDQLSLLTSVGRRMSTGQSAVMRCG